MSLFTRLTTLIKADAHGVVDALEDKGLLLRQCLREAEQELGRKRAQLTELEVEEKALAERQVELTRRRETLDRDADLALRAGEEALCRFALRKLLPLEQELRRSEARRQALVEEQAELTVTLQEQEERYVQLEYRVKACAQRLDNPPENGGTLLPAPARVEDEEVELELLRRRRALQPVSEDTTPLLRAAGAEEG